MSSVRFADIICDVNRLIRNKKKKELTIYVFLNILSGRLIEIFYFFICFHFSHLSFDHRLISIFSDETLN